MMHFGLPVHLAPGQECPDWEDENPQPVAGKTKGEKK